MAKYYYINKVSDGVKSTIYSIKNFNSCLTDEYQKPDSKGNIPKALNGAGSAHVEVGDMVETVGTRVTYYKVYNGEILDMSIYEEKINIINTLYNLRNCSLLWDNVDSKYKQPIIDIIVSEIINYGNDLLKISKQKIDGTIKTTDI